MAALKKSDDFNVISDNERWRNRYFKNKRQDQETRGIRMSFKKPCDFIAEVDFLVNHLYHHFVRLQIFQCTYFFI